jgi:hypothetical protein
MIRLQELQEHRANDCRLTPDRALQTLDEAEEFLRDRGLLTRTADCSLPSLFEACHEEPYAASSAGFGQWPKTKWSWSGALLERDGVYGPKIHRGKTLYLTAETAALADPLCRAELARMEAESPDWERLLRHLGNAGPSSAEDLRLELDLKARELKALRHPLERCGAILSLRLEESRIARWDHVFAEPAPGGGIEDLLVAGVRASVVAPEDDLRRWFTWKLRPGLVDELVAAGRLERPAPGWLCLPDRE